MNILFCQKLKEAFFSVLPVALIILLINFFIEPIPKYNFVLLIVSIVILSIGISLFTIGSEMCMIPFGESISYKIIKTKKLALILIVSFLMGFIITIAEPDLNVLAMQIPMINTYTLICTVAIGVGLFLAIAFLRILLQIEYKYILLFFYALVFVLAAFSTSNFIAIAFDSGGVTTGPITVPFILSLGLGFSAITTRKKGDADTFGFVGLCSIGPILSVLLLGLVYNVDSAVYEKTPFIIYENIRQILSQIWIQFKICFNEVSISIIPIVGMFLLFQFLILKLSKTKIIKIMIGFMYTFLGLVIFLTSVNVGFLPVGYFIGEHLALSINPMIIFLMVFIFGFAIVFAEPAVIVLKNQVEEITNGMITSKTLSISLGIGVAFAVGLAIVRIFYSVPIWYFILPGYILAILLSFMVPTIFSEISFDAGGVASGPMTATFLLPMALGISEKIGGDIYSDAFGLVAMVAMTPIITIQILGLIYKIRLSILTKRNKENDNVEDKFIVTNYENEGGSKND